MRVSKIRSLSSTFFALSVLSSLGVLGAVSPPDNCDKIPQPRPILESIYSRNVDTFITLISETAGGKSFSGAILSSATMMYLVLQKTESQGKSPISFLPIEPFDALYEHVYKSQLYCFNSDSDLWKYLIQLRDVNVDGFTTPIPATTNTVVPKKPTGVFSGLSLSGNGGGKPAIQDKSGIFTAWGGKLSIPMKHMNTIPSIQTENNLSPSSQIEGAGPPPVTAGTQIIANINNEPSPESGAGAPPDSADEYADDSEDDVWVSETESIVLQDLEQPQDGASGNTGSTSTNIYENVEQEDKRRRRLRKRAETTGSKITIPTTEQPQLTIPSANVNGNTNAQTNTNIANANANKNAPLQMQTNTTPPNNPQTSTTPKQSFSQYLHLHKLSSLNEYIQDLAIALESVVESPVIDITPTQSGELKKVGNSWRTPAQIIRGVFRAIDEFLRYEQNRVKLFTKVEIKNRYTELFQMLGGFPSDPKLSTVSSPFVLTTPSGGAGGGAANGLGAGQVSWPLFKGPLGGGPSKKPGNNGGQNTGNN
ncbi:hypothetical protein H072_1487 [Dactylellina haptotyla CBS 200.50]|uniref:Uncharacterized protein n=1 Tax=Dactylellina haptotyla (strain CBS 200.50) TaxID=1284197 RepID=S8AU58_DACHA|nr:hypothetical protein H072_1487 [Dactylellina haptotyla CBS 200.50]